MWRSTCFGLQTAIIFEHLLIYIRPKTLSQSQFQEGSKTIQCRKLWWKKKKMVLLLHNTCTGAVPHIQRSSRPAALLQCCASVRGSIITLQQLHLCSNQINGLFCWIRKDHSSESLKMSKFMIKTKANLFYKGQRASSWATTWRLAT